MSNQFGSNQNPPWVRQDFATQNNTAAPMLQPNVSYPFTQAQQQNQFAPQQQIAAPGVSANIQQAAPSGGLLPQPGIALPTSLSANTVAQVNPVSYPVKTQAGTNTVPKQRMFTGSVTKMHDTFGFVDEEVFFQMSVIKGMVPKVGDRVLVEASYNANMPFKWNATRVVSLHDNMANNQVISIQQQQQQQHQQQQQQQQNQLKAIQQQALGLMGAGPLMGSNAQMLGGASPGLSGGQGLLSNPPGPPPLMTGLNKFQSGGVFNSPNNRPGVNTGPGLLGDPRPRSLLSQMKDQRNSMGGNMGPGSGGRGGGGGDSQKDRERRDRERRERRTEERRKRSRSPPAPNSNKRSRSPASSVRSRSPVKRRSTRPTPRYVVQVPKILLDVMEASVMTLKAKYSNLYIPSDFFHTSFPWVENFPLTRPFSLGQHCSFHIMHKEVPPIKENDVVLEPADADYLFSAKVMLMASPALEELYKKSCCLAEDLPDAYDTAQHPARLLNFLVGTRGKNEPMAIGGAWSPSLDGANPQANPQVLIKTAIRTTKALTGIDLSACTQWYRFTEIRYFRPESKHKDRLQPARVETVVIFLPDVWNCNPTHLEWNSLQAAYQKQLQLKLNPEMAATLQQEEEEEMETETTQDDKTEPSHYSLLDPKTMKVGDLRRELELRNMSPKGLKSQLVARLAKVAKAEEEAEKLSKEEEAEKAKKEEEARVVEEQKLKEKAKEEEERDEDKKKEEEEKQRKEKREKAILERRYKLPDHPTILVHPSATAKSGKFDCSVMSLSVLLDYRPEDNKEHSFEVSLFAELFNEMLMRDFGFQIYCAVAQAPAKKEEEKKKDESKKDEKKDKEDKERKEEDKKDKDQDKKDKKEKKDQDKKEDKGNSSPKRRKVENKESGEDGGKEEESHKDKDGDKDEDRKSDKDKDDKKKKKEEDKKVTTKPDLLLAFSYFDQNHCGYLSDKDVEDIIHTLGLKLSRAQIKKMVQKVLHHDSFKYRKFTDGSVNDKGEIVDENDEDVEVTKMEPEQLARGNRESLRKLLELSGVKTEKNEKQSSATAKGDDNSRNFVDYKGSLLDIESLMQKLERSEKSRAALEKTLLVTNDELKTVKSNLSKTEKDSNRLSQDLRKVKLDLEGEKSARTSSEAVNQEWHQLASSSRTHIMNALNSINTMLTSGDKKSKNEEGKKNGVKKESIEANLSNVKKEIIQDSSAS